MKDQYVVYRSGEKTCSWGLVTHTDGKNVSGIDEKGLPYVEGSDHMFEVPVKDVVAVLGKKPRFGNAYGCKIEPFLKTVEHGHWGSLHFFIRMADADKEKLKTSLNTVAKKLQRNGLSGFMPIDIEIRNPMGRWAGSYKFFPKEGERDTMKLHPKTWDQPDYLLYHEAGHGVWFRLMSKKAKAAWIELYHAYVKVAECNPRTVRTLKTDFCKQDTERVQDFRGQLDENDALVFDACIDHITSTHSLSVDHLNTLILSGRGAIVGSLWPTIQVLHTDYEYPISDYASTRPEEFFAEAFAYHFTGTQKLPDRIAKLLEKTLQRVAGRKV